ncbi:sugar phosphate isomerase/epimerase family protein [Bacillus solitudinis]|uniref:sugar phosphate isomerase/epimerase family protein n=1 Tax=Bacillus solitudinis TaxID=2014074 RepID=UPI000C243D8B|nr:sugar phosphate isomerase/epimerase family protein [Bacillus solitudinis]
MKFSVFTVIAPDLTPDEILTSLKEYGYDGVEWRYKEKPQKLQEEKPSFWGNNLCTIAPDYSKEKLTRLLEKTKKLGIETVSVTPYLACGDIEETEKVLHVAETLGASMIRVGVPSYNRSENYHDLFEKAVRYLHEVEEMCKQYNIKGLVETHHMTITPSASLAYRLVNTFDPKHIGVLYDPGNMVHEGYENYRMGLELLGPYLAHVHAKNTGWEKKERHKEDKSEWTAEWKLIEEGLVDWKQVLTDLKAVGYDGYIGMEDFSMQKSTKETLKHNINWFKTMLNQG